MDRPAAPRPRRTVFRMQISGLPETSWQVSSPPLLDPWVPPPIPPSRAVLDPLLAKNTVLKHVLRNMPSLHTTDCSDDVVHLSVALETSHLAECLSRACAVCPADLTSMTIWRPCPGRRLNLAFSILRTRWTHFGTWTYHSVSRISKTLPVSQDWTSSTQRLVVNKEKGRYLHNRLEFQASRSKLNKE